MQNYFKNKWYNVYINGKKKSRMLLLLAVAVTVEIVAGAQPPGTGYLVFNVNIPEVALLDIEPAGNTEISLIIAPPGEAGEAPVLANSLNNSQIGRASWRERV